MIRKIVYSYWSTPLKSRWSNLLQDYSPEYQEEVVFNCLLLSVLQAKKWGFRVELVTDVYGENKLNKIPFDRISTELEFLPDSSNSWVQGKLLAIALQNEPFIHLDWDVFLLKNEVVDVLKNFKEDLLVQSVDGDELFINNYRTLLYRLAQDMDYTQYHIPGLHKLHKKGFNCGVMGFNNMTLKNEFVNNFTRCLQKTESDFVEDMSLVIEQGLLYSLVESKGYTYQTILGLDKPSADEIGYTHLIYLSKYSQKNQDKIKEKIKSEFPDYAQLVTPKEETETDSPILSLCTVVMNRFDHLVKTLKHNYELIKPYKGKINIHLLDYNSTDGLEEFLYSQDWFVRGLKRKLIHFYKNYDADKDHRTLPKNVVHENADGQYVVNVDADNYVKKSYLEFVLEQIKESRDFFIRPEQKSEPDSYGRILLKKSDFSKLKGYNLGIQTWGFEDSEFIARLKLLGKTQILAPQEICGGNIMHGNEMRIDSDSRFDIPYKLDYSLKKNRQVTVELHPNQSIRIPSVKFFKLDENQKKEQI
jgi:hypothetical protein